MGFRKITNHGGVRKFTGKFPSYVHKKIISYESRLERDFLYLLEWDHLDVYEIVEQGCRIHYVFDGKRRRFTVDFAVTRKTKRQIIEIKYSGRAGQPKYQAAFSAARELAEREGSEFKIYTEKTIQRQPRLNNVKLLIYYQRAELHPLHQVLCREFFASRIEASLQELMEFFAANGADKSIVYTLLRWGFISCDINAPLIPEARVYPPSRNAENRRMA
jgi:hypothetical protein